MSLKKDKAHGQMWHTKSRNEEKNTGFFFSFFKIHYLFAAMKLQ